LEKPSRKRAIRGNAREFAVDVSLLTMLSILSIAAAPASQALVRDRRQNFEPIPELDVDDIGKVSSCMAGVD